MFRIDIYSDKEGHFWLKKKTQQEVDEYVQWCKDTHHWGIEEQKIVVQKYKPAYEELIPGKEAVIAEDGSIIEPAVDQVLIQHPEVPEILEIIPATYKLVIEDISAQVQQEQINTESLKFLAETDWYVLREVEGGKKMPKDIKDKRQQARDAIKRG